MIFPIRRTILVIFLFCIFFGAGQRAYGQVDRGTIVGTVMDASSARVSGAKVTVSNLETNQRVDLVTDDEGNYSAPLLKIGRYLVRVDLSLKVGAATETVEVTSAAPLLQTEASSLGTIETQDASRICL